MSEQNANIQPQDVKFNECIVDLTLGEISISERACKNMEEVLGGFGRAYSILAERDITDPYSPENPLIVSTGLLTGTQIMTGLRTYFSSYSPLKVSNKGLPGAMWSAASGKFGTKLRWTGIDQIIFEGRSETPVFLHVQQTDDGPVVKLIPGQDYLGLGCHEKIMKLRETFDDCHYAVIGTAGESYENCYYGSVGCSTENMMKSGEDKCRWAGRAGMGSVLGSKNMLGIIADARDERGKPSEIMREMNKFISSGPGSRKYREEKKGGMGGTWSNYVGMGKKNIVPENNFRPPSNPNFDKLIRQKVEEELTVKAENCFRCAISCHKNIYTKNEDGSRGQFMAKFDYEPLNLLSTNLGIHNGTQAAILVGLCDKYGMDSISLGVTLGYVMDYNERNPDTAILDNLSFGEFEKIRDYIIKTGKGECPELGRGSKRLSESLGQPGYAMHVKGLELPAYLPETNPGYLWAIAGGHMSMQTYSVLASDGDTSLDYWEEKIVEKGLYMVRDDLSGICKFANLDGERMVQAIKDLTGIDMTEEMLRSTVRNAFIRGLWLERKQGFDDSDYTLPGEIFDRPNHEIGTPIFITPEYLQELKRRVFNRFNKEIDTLCA